MASNMKQALLATTLIASLASAMPHYADAAPAKRDLYNNWSPGGETDVRGPCPMMNTLANHNFLPHSGKNITLENAVYALTTALNFNASVATVMWEQAIIVNPEPNATFFTLEQLNVHGVLEHDASISRLDAAFGNNHVFDQATFDASTVYWTKDVLDAAQLANSKIFAQLQSKSANPNYTFSQTTEAFSRGELAAPVLIFGDIPAMTVPKDLVVYFFENERLPTELGWVKQATPISIEEVLETTQKIGDATNLITGSDSAIQHRDLMRDLHSFGF